MPRLIRVLVASIAALAVFVSVGIADSPAQAADAITISGTIYLDSTATPVPAGDVSIRTAYFDGSSWSAETEQAVSETGGTWSLTIVPGDYHLDFVYTGDDGYQSQYYGRRVAPSSLHFSTTSTLANVVLEPYYAASGTVRLVDGAAIAAGDVRVELWQNDVLATSTLVEDGGDWSLPVGLNFENYTVVSRYIASSQYATASRPSHGRYLSGMVSQLLRNNTISGQVDLGSVGNHAAPSQVGVTLSKRYLATGVVSGAGSTFTDTDGRYAFSGVQSTQEYEFLLTFSATGWVTLKPAGATDHIQVWTEDVVRDVVLQPPPTIAGTVTNAGGEPVAGITVEIIHYSDDDGTADGSFSGGVTGADGSYLARNLQPGYVSVRFSDGGGPYAPAVWQGHSPFHEPDYLLLEAGDAVTNVDLRLPLAGEILGTATGTGFTAADWSHATAELEVYDSARSAWVRTGSKFPLSSTGGYTISDLFPQKYRVAIDYSGSKGSATAVSGTLTLVAGGSAIFNPKLTPSARPPIGRIVKSASSSALYLVTSGWLVQLGSKDQIKDFGFNSTILTVPDAFIQASEIDESPLSNFVSCDGWLSPANMTIASGGGLISWFDGDFGLWSTYLDDASCAKIKKRQTFPSNGFYVGSTLWAIGPDGRRHVIERPKGRNPAIDFYFPDLEPALAPAKLVVNSWFVSQWRLGAHRVPDGMLVKFGNDPRIYLEVGYERLQRITLATVHDFGWSTLIATLPATVKSDFTEIIETPMSNIVQCSGDLAIGANGGLYRITGDVANVPEDVLPVSSLGGSQVACSNGPIKVSNNIWKSIRGPLFVRTSSTSRAYWVDGTGVKHGVLYSSQAKAKSPSQSPIYLTVNKGFFDSIPTGPDLVATRLLVKAPNGKVYLVDGSGGLIPVNSVATARSLGITSSVIPVSQVTIDSLTVGSDPLRQLVTCGGVLMLGTTTSLVPVPPEAFPGQASTALPDTLCARLTIGAAVSTVFLRTAPTGTVYWIDGGVRRVTASAAQRAALALPGSVRILTAASAFVAALPSGGKVIANASLVKATTAKTVYFLDGATRHPVSSTELGTDLGVGTGVTAFSNAEIAAYSPGPALSNVVTCLGGTWLAASGRIWQVAPASVAGLTSTALADETCGSLRHGSSELGELVFLRSRSSGAIYLLPDGQRHAVSSVAKANQLAGGTATIVTVRSAFVSSVHAGAPAA